MIVPPSALCVGVWSTIKINRLIYLKSVGGAARISSRPSPPVDISYGWHSIRPGPAGVTRCARAAIHLPVGNGYINDYPTGRLLRAAKLYEIGAGTSEIRRMLIGRELFEKSA